MTKITRRQMLHRAAGSVAALPVLAVAARAATHQVSIQGFAFSPASITIAAGDTVVFTNADNAPHTATADSGAFDTGRLGRDASAQLTFSNPGTYTYFCNFHRNMKGSITVA
ncbi:cupredoxin domain-containing protein [Flavimaricola marinus]|uniref:Plastocyanin n=1 Tax=Flavimaricola marinus TaxID=1819565 RepID=A0A238LED8_9RHOB|nr:cupredoxin family copper-binding protein [Flavimaricola marinus]SMY07923.1 Plastocyanin precursor [Flavimaricola marinus]